MRYFQLINPIRNQYPLVGEKEIYIEENGVQTLILKRNIIANFPNETMEIAHDLFLEDVQREQSYNSIKIEVDSLYMSPETMVSSTKEDNDLLQWQDSKNKSEIYVLVSTDNFLDQLDHCYAKSINSAKIEFSMRGWVIGDVMTHWEYQGVLQNENDLNSLENQSNEC